VVESVFEDLTLKKDLFNSMGDLLKERAVLTDQVLLCSNTMAIPMADITEEVCKEYRGSCIGMRFLHPVWFIDEVRSSAHLFDTIGGV
jgi:3-hydroxyacyl-CoA dehydrogenase